MARDARFRCAAQWIDEEWSFAESLLKQNKMAAPVACRCRLKPNG